MMRLAIGAGRKTRTDLKLGICGEHGGDAKSIEFCHQLGLDYVSCSPYRVAIARLAAAHSAMNGKPATKAQPKSRNAAASRAKAPAKRTKKTRSAKR
jgi:pyruvate,orthophosphate dikinase